MNPKQARFVALIRTWIGLGPVLPPVLPVALVHAFYRLKEDNPFRETTVEVLERRAGWVQYRFVTYNGHRTASRGNRSELEEQMFCRIYEECSQVERDGVD